MDEARGMEGDGGGASAALEARLEAYARSVGGSSDSAVFTGSPGGAAGAPAGGEFVRAVAARRVAVVAKVGLGIGGVVGLLVVVVVMAMRTAPPPPATRMPVRHEEPTFWNLREGVQNPAGLDDVAGLQVQDGMANGDGAGVAPGTWPEDLRP